MFCDCVKKNNNQPETNDEEKLQNLKKVQINSVLTTIWKFDPKFYPKILQVGLV